MATTRAKKSEVKKSVVSLRKNRRTTAGTGNVVGQLTEVLGAGGAYELYSEANFKGTSRIWFKGFAEGSEDYDWIFTCSTELSKELRSAESEEEFDEILDSIEFANVTATTVQAKDRNGKPLFDEEGEPKMEDVYYLGFGENGADMSSSKRDASGDATEVAKEKSVFSWESLAAGF